MIRKSVQRFSEKIMRKQQAKARWRFDLTPSRFKVITMPETHLPNRYLAPLLLLFVGTALGACSGGDFWRSRTDFRNDDMHRWVGAEATASVGARPSRFQLTDDERQLR